MRYLIALVISVLFIVGMFVFRNIMTTQEKQWLNQGVNLPPFQILLVTFEHLIWKYWYIPALMIPIFCFAMAALFPSCKINSKK
jgi:hypothetical protein